MRFFRRIISVKGDFVTSSGGRSNVVRGVLRWLTRHPSKRPALNWTVWVVAALTALVIVTPKNNGGADSKAASASVSASASASTSSPVSTSAAPETSSEAASASVASTTEAPSTAAAPVSASPTATIAPSTKAASSYPPATKDYLRATHRMRIKHADGTSFSDAELIKTGKITCQALAIDGVPFETRKSVLANTGLTSRQQNTLLLDSATAFCPSRLDRATPPPSAAPAPSTSRPAPTTKATHPTVRHTHSSPPAPANQCTTTSSGSCIQGGEFCKQVLYGQTGTDAEGRRYTCTGDHIHPHWEK